MAKTLDLLRLDKVGFSYGDNEVIFKDLNLEIKSGEKIAIVGKSGCGKTTLVKILAGYIEPISGSIKVNDSQKNQFKCVVINQENDIFDWLTVKQNMDLVKIEDTTSQHWLSVVGLETYHSKKGANLSMGMKKRLSFARAMAVGADMIILDEPFASLDYIRREKLYDELISISSANGTTILIVTHDINEAVRLSNKVYCLHGRPCNLTTVDISGDSSKDKKLIMKVLENKYPNYD